MRKIISLFLITFFLLLSASCGTGRNSANSMYLTLTPLTSYVRETATAGANNTSGAGQELETAIAQATAKSADIYATQTVLAAANNEANNATATVIAPAVAELPRYGIEPSQGRVAWVHPPVTIDLQGYQQTGYANDFQQITAKDFVMAADITWYTYNSLSACGFMFRSNGDANNPSQYMVVITRYAQGYLAFTATVNGEMSNMRTYYPRQEDKSFTWENNGTNRLAIVVKGALIDAYTNGVLIGEIDTTQPPPNSMQTPPSPSLPNNASSAQMQEYQNLIAQNSQNLILVQGQMSLARQNFAKNKPIFSEGLLGFIGVSQSGHTTCTFNNAWLFLLND